MKRMISIMLCMVMILALFPATIAFAEGNDAAVEAERQDHNSEFYAQTQEPETVEIPETIEETREMEATENDVEKEDVLSTEAQEPSTAAQAFLEDDQALLEADMPDAEVNAVGGNTNPVAFSDVSIKEWYYDAVKWAVQESVTGGTGNGTTFEPMKSLTRAEVVTFFWAYNGSPKAPEGTARPFPDVKKSDWFFDAVVWAKQNNIVGGITVNGVEMFVPKQVCSRGEFVTFLYAAAGQPDYQKEGLVNPYSDVKSSKYYYKPVMWGVSNGIFDFTEIQEDSFAPEDKEHYPCTRALAVTLMYRAFADDNVYRIINANDLVNRSIRASSPVTRICECISTQAGTHDLYKPKKEGGYSFFVFKIDNKRSIKVNAKLFCTNTGVTCSPSGYVKDMTNKGQFENSFFYVKKDRHDYANGCDRYRVYFESLLVTKTYYNGTKSVTFNAQVQQAAWLEVTYDEDDGGINALPGRAYVWIYDDGGVDFRVGKDAAWLELKPSFQISTEADKSLETYLTSFSFKEHGTDTKSKIDLGVLMELYAGGQNAAGTAWKLMTSAAGQLNPVKWYEVYKKFDRMVNLCKSNGEISFKEGKVQFYTRENGSDKLTYRMKFSAPVPIKEPLQFFEVTFDFDQKNSSPKYNAFYFNYDYELDLP